MVGEIETAKQLETEIEARRLDILKIEATIKELHDMFLDLAQLIAAQV